MPASPMASGQVGKPPFLAGVFLISFAMLMFQIVQTRILSVIAWYYLAFFAISVAMLGMTVGAVLVYRRRERFPTDEFSSALSTQALVCAISMPLSLLVQLSLITTITVSISSLVSWSLLLVAMTTPYVFAGIVISLALTRSPFPVSQVYAVDLFGAALGCVAVVLLLNVVNAPSAVLCAGACAALSAACFLRGAPQAERQALRTRARFLRPAPFAVALLLLGVVNAVSPIGIRPILVKDRLERLSLGGFERWNSYSRVIAGQPTVGRPSLWGGSAKLPSTVVAEYVPLNIDGEAGTDMFRYNGNPASVEFLRYDLVNLAYNLPNIRKSAIIGVGGGRDVLSAHIYGVPEIVGVELNRIFIDLHTREWHRTFSNLATLPGVQLFVDDARSWFASTSHRFDLVQMSMIDTWAATGAGAFSLSENGLYTLEGWRAFLRTLNDDGVLTVSRWYSPENVNEAGRMVALATAALLDAGAADPRPHMFVAHAENIATLVLSKRPFTATQLGVLHHEVDRLGFGVLLAPDRPAGSSLLAGMVASTDLASLNQMAGGGYLDLTVPTDNRPFFFNQLAFSRIPEAVRRKLAGAPAGGVIGGNLLAAGTLVIILFISTVAVILTIVVPLRGAIRHSSSALIAAGTAYFSLLGMGFMFAEIALLQYFSVYLGHPIYSLAVCLFSVILATGLGSLASGRIKATTATLTIVWAVVVGAYLFGLPFWLTDLFQATTGRVSSVRILVTLAVVMPLAFVLGFGFPTGMKLVQAVDSGPTSWFWGMNGAAGVLASVLAVMLSLAYGIHVTLFAAAISYLCVIPAALALVRLGRRETSVALAAERASLSRALTRGPWRSSQAGLD